MALERDTDFPAFEDTHDPALATANALASGVQSGLRSVESGSSVAQAPMEGVQQDPIPETVAMMAMGPLSNVAKAAVGDYGAVVGNEIGALGERNVIKGTTQNMYNNAKTIVRGNPASAQILDTEKTLVPNAFGPAEGPRVIGDKTISQIQGPKTLPPQQYTPDPNAVKSVANVQGYAEGGEVLPAFDQTQDLAPSPTQQALGPSDQSLPAFDQTTETNEEKYGTTGEMAKTFAEGAGRGATFGLSTGAETALGVEPEAIRARKETNPLTSAAGELAGLGASALIPGVGEANILGKAGELGVQAVGLAGAEALLPKIGSKAVQMAVETALYQGGDEVSKMLASDPNQTAQTALTDIGLAALLGGATGTVLGGANPLWKATQGSKVGSTLKAISDKFGGIDGHIPDTVKDAIEAAGLDIAPEIKAGLSADPGLQHTFQHLQEASTSSGLKAQEALHKFRASASDQLADAFGKSPKEVEKLADMSDYEAGEGIKKSVSDSLKAQIDPVSKQFEKIKTRFSATPIDESDKRSIIDNILKMSVDHGYDLSPAAPQAKLIDRVLGELPNLKSAQDIRKYASVVSDSVNNPEMYRVGGQLRRILREAEENVVEKRLGEEAPELLETHAQARASYKDIMGTIEDLNERLHVGKYHGPDSFLTALKEMPPEDVLRRLGTKSDAGLLDQLSERFPSVADSIRNYHIDKILKTAADKAYPGQLLNSKVLFNQIDKMSPELKAFTLSEQGSAKIDAIKTILEQLPQRMNPSGTAKTLDSLLSSLPASAGGMVDLLRSGHLGAGALMGHLGKVVGRDIPDAARLAFLKFMGSTKPVEAEGFKQMTDFIQATMKGEAMLSKGSKNLFRAGADVLPSSAMPTERDRVKLDKHIALLDANPSAIMEMGAKSAHYMPEATAAMTQSATTAMQLIKAAKPGQNRAAPLDSKPVLSAGQKSEYDNVLNLAQQPLLLLSKAKDGTITSKDVKIVASMYPALYERMSSKVLSQIADAQAKGDIVPYKTRMGLSMMLGKPIDSTFSPQAIMAAQMVSQTGQQAQKDMQQGQQAPAASKTNKLGKIASDYQTPGQAREAKHQKPEH